MKPIGVFYATREGHTHKLAERVADDLRKRGFEADVKNLRDQDAINLSDYAGAILAASVHTGTHEPEMVAFVKQHRAELESMPSAFLSVTLSEVGAERANATAEEHARFVADVQGMLNRFFEDTGLAPAARQAGGRRAALYQLPHPLRDAAHRQKGRSGDGYLARL